MDQRVDVPVRVTTTARARQPINLTSNARVVLEKRYLRRGLDGKPIESPEEMFDRVARVMAEPEARYGGDPIATREKFYDLLTTLRFFPNSPTFTGAGTPLGQLAACFVLPITDDMGRDARGIFSTLRAAALIQQTGGGNGFSFSRLRPHGDRVATSAGVASGPVGFLRVYDTAFGEVAQGGTRRGANMAVLRVDHPDILEFVRCKTTEGAISNFNISVGVTDEFMRAVENDGDFDLINPRDGKVWRTIRARELFDEIVKHAHHNGEPGVLFLDAANRQNPVPHLYELEATNPCITGETLVAVADGRGAVPIRELANEGRDVPVYCQSPAGVTIRWGRRPRKTRSDAPVFKITLDDGSTIRATADHKFMLRDGTYSRLEELRPGDRLMPFNKYQYLQTNKGDQRYWGILLNQPGNSKGWAPEHRLMMEFATGKKIRYPEQIVHHRDYDGLNNCWDNLAVMSASAHDALHRERMLGDNNPMRGCWWERRTPEEQRNYRQRMSALFAGENNPRHGVTLSDDLRARIKSSVNNFWSDPSHRSRHGQSIPAAMTDAVRAKLSASKVAPRETRKCANPECDQTFQVTRGSRQRYHSHQCSTMAGRQTYASGIPDRHQSTCAAQVALGLALKSELGRLPLKREFAQSAEERGVNPHVGYYWQDYDAFLNTLENANHRIVSVEFDGTADVYNITVDEFHNLAYITNRNALTRTDQVRWSGVMAANCGEQWLGPYENCCLGSINLAPHITSDNKMDWAKLRDAVELATHFLDNVVDANKYVPAVPELADAAHRARRIGLGIMGLGDAMYRLGVRYGSREGEEFAGQVMEFVRFNSMKTSIELAKTRGAFPAIKGSLYDPENLKWTPPKPLEPGTREWSRPRLDWGEIVAGIKKYGIRNAAQTTVAPTGTIATVAGVESYGCEPVFALAYTRHVDDNGKDLQLEYVSPAFERALIDAGLDDATRQKIFERVRVTGTCQDIDLVPEKIRDTFVVASDITPEQHVRMQAALQAFVDNSMSKTINFSAAATVDDVERAYFLAWKLGCKGITVYVAGSREQVVLETRATVAKKSTPSEIAAAKKPRPRAVHGSTYEIATPLGKAYVTINRNGSDQPFEVFCNVGKAGSDTAAVSEAIGRLISLALRLPSPLSPTERLQEIVDQLGGIGGGRPMGFGARRVRSLPDGIAQALAEDLGQVRVEPNESKQMQLFQVGDLCPECGQASFVNEEGCRKCYACGYSEC